MALKGAQIAFIVLCLIVTSAGAVGCYMAKMIREYFVRVRIWERGGRFGGVFGCGESGVVGATRMEEGKIERCEVVHIQHDTVDTQVERQPPRQRIQIQHTVAPYGIQARDFAYPPPVFPVPPVTPPVERLYGVVFQQFDEITATVAPATPVTPKPTRSKSFECLQSAITPPSRAAMRV